MKIIFLDIDGVLNSRNWFDWLEANKPPEVTHITFTVDPKAVSCLNKIIAQTGAKVVISSSWRFMLPNPPFTSIQDEIFSLLTKAGFNGEIIDMTPKTIRGDLPMPGSRGSEIQTWFLDNPNIKVDSFCILDDSSDMDGVSEFLVKTTFQAGLLDKHVDLAVKLLN